MDSMVDNSELPPTQIVQMDIDVESEKEQDLPETQVLLTNEDNNDVLKVNEDTNETQKIDVKKDLSDDELIEIAANHIVKKSQVSTEESVLIMTVKCTACGVRVNHSDSLAFRKHPHLGVLVCKECCDFYGSGQFSVDEDGDKYCRWCANGGTLYGCDFCTNAFCMSCIRRNMGRSELVRVRDADKWKCYICDSQPLKLKVNFCDFLIDFKEKNRKNETKKLGKLKNNLVDLTSEANDPLLNNVLNMFDLLRACSLRFDRRVSKLKSKYVKEKDIPNTFKTLEALLERRNRRTRCILTKAKEICGVSVKQKASSEVNKDSSRVNSILRGSTDIKNVDLTLDDDFSCKNVNAVNNTKSECIVNGHLDEMQNSKLLGEKKGVNNHESPVVDDNLNDVYVLGDSNCDAELEKSTILNDASKVLNGLINETAKSDKQANKCDTADVLNKNVDGTQASNTSSKDHITETNGDLNSEEDINSMKMRDNIAKLMLLVKSDSDSDDGSNDLKDSTADNNIIHTENNGNALDSASPVNSSLLDQKYVEMNSFRDNDDSSDFTDGSVHVARRKRGISVKKKSNGIHKDMSGLEDNLKKNGVNNQKNDLSDNLNLSDMSTSNAELKEMKSKGISKGSQDIAHFSAKEVSKWNVNKKELLNDEKLNTNALVYIQSLPLDEVKLTSKTTEQREDVEPEESSVDELAEIKRAITESENMLKREPGSSTAAKRTSHSQVKKGPTKKKKKVKKSQNDLELSEDSDDTDCDKKKEILLKIKMFPKLKVKDEDSLAKEALLKTVCSSDSSLEDEIEIVKALNKEHSATSIKTEPKEEAKNETDSNQSGNDDSDDFINPKRKKTKEEKLLKVSLAMGKDKSKEKEKSKKPKGKQKSAKRKILYSDESGKESSNDSDSESKSSDFSVDSDFQSSNKRKGKGNTKKRKRVKTMDSSSENEKNSNDEDIPGSQGKGRKNIRKLISDKKLTDKTKEAQDAEIERRRRVEERQKFYNKVIETTEDGTAVTKKMVLEVHPESKEELVEIPYDIIEKLKPHQINGVRFMWECTIESLKELETKPGSGCILAHCMGLGKTLQVIAFLYTVLNNKHVKKKIRTALVICPYNTVLNWATEFEMWLEDVDESVNIFEMSTCNDYYTRLYLLKRWQEEGGIMISGYDIFRRLVDGNIKNAKKKMKAEIFECLVDPGPDIVVCDEGHTLKNKSSAISKACNRLRTSRRIVLTGTPLQNNLKEYFCMVSFVKPNLLGTEKEFRNRFVNPIINGQYDDSSKHDVKLMKKRVHILHKLLEGCVQRCDYSVLTKCLPPKHEFVISVKLSEVQIKMYRYYLENCSSDENNKLSGRRLLRDHHTFQFIWTHPYLCVTAHKRAELHRMMKESDGEESMNSFIDDDATSATPDSSSENDDSIKVLEDLNKKDSKKKEDGESSGDEVIKVYKTRSRAGGDNESEDEEPEIPEKKEWFHEFISEEDKFKIELSGKMVLVFDILKECESIGDKVIIFSTSLLTLDLIEDMLGHVDSEPVSEEDKVRDVIGTWTKGIDYFRMDGKTNVDYRKRWIEIFNDKENLRARLFLISTKAGSLGTNLIGANRVILLDASWNPSHDVQAIFRVYRFGQDKPVYIYRLLAQGAMEEKIYDRQVTKLSMSCRVVDEQQIDRHFNAAQLSELYEFDPDNKSKRPTPMVPQDPLLAEMLIRHNDWIVTYHEHDSLLQSSKEDDLTEEERQAAWTEYENEKEGLLNAVQAGLEGLPKEEPRFAYDDSPDAHIVRNADDMVRNIIEKVKSQSKMLSNVQMFNQIQSNLMNLRSYYQTRHAKTLRQKQEFVSRNEPVPVSMNRYLDSLAAAVTKTTQYILQFKNSIQVELQKENLERQRMQQQYANQRNQQRPQAQQQTWNQPGMQAPRPGSMPNPNFTNPGPYYFGARGPAPGMRQSYRPFAGRGGQTYVNLNTGEKMSFLPRGVNVRFQFTNAPKTSTEGPVITEVTEVVDNEKDVETIVCTPIITEIDDVEEPSQEKRSQNIPFITEIE